MSVGVRPVRRRLLLAMGAVTLLEGCADPARARGQARPGPSDLPRGSRSEPPGSSAGPSPSPWQVPAPNPPVAGQCPTVPGVVQRPGGPQHYLPCNGTDIALTIDDGPDPVWTPQILALLARYRIPATFCVIGRRAVAHPDLIAAVVGAGHHIANHTFTHPLPLTRLSPPQLQGEIDRTSDVIASLTGGHRPTLFRAPGGEWSPAVLAACTSAGMRPLDWSVDPRDWSLPGTRHIVETILTETHPGSIILDHDGGGNRQQTIDALTIALPRLLDAGYRFVQP